MNSCALYLITDGKTYPEERLEQALLGAPAGSVAVQLRNRTLGGAALLRLAERLRVLTKLFSAPFFVNDRLDVALAAGADGVHLPGQGLSPLEVRNLVGDRLHICAATHSIAEAQKRVAQGADFVTFGPIWPTPSKPDDPSIPLESRVVPVGIEVLAAAVSALPVPVFALGGIDTVERAEECAAVGARLACLRAILGDDDPKAATASFVDAIRRSA